MMIEVAGGVLIAASICGVFMFGLNLVLEDVKWSGGALMAVALIVGFGVVMAGGGVWVS